MDATGPAPPAATYASASGTSFSAAAYATLTTGDEEPLPLFWSKVAKDDEFAGRLAAL